MTRVQIPAYSDFWMMGDRFGEVVKTSKRIRGPQFLDEPVTYEEIAHVKLDKSGKTVKVILDDCTVI